MLKLKLQYFGHLMRRADSLEKTLMLGKIEGVRRRGCQSLRCWVASLTQWTCFWVSSRSWWWTEKPGVLQSMGLQRVVHDWETELTELTDLCLSSYCRNCPTQMGLRPSQNPGAWSNGLWLKFTVSNWNRILVSGLKKLRFFMCQCRRNSVRGKVIG